MKSLNPGDLYKYKDDIQTRALYYSFQTSYQANTLSIIEDRYVILLDDYYYVISENNETILYKDYDEAIKNIGFNLPFVKVFASQVGFVYLNHIERI